MIATLFLLHARAAKRYFERERLARAITVFAFVLVILALAVGVYALFLDGLRYILQFSFSANAVSLYTYELTLFTIAGLMFASALISGVFRLFQGEYDFWFIASPAFPEFPWYVCLNILLSSLWPIIVIGVPALFAMNTAFHPGAIAFIVALISLVLLGIFTIMCALIFLLIAAWVLRGIGVKRVLSGLITAILVVFVLGACVFWGQIKNIVNIADLFPGVATPSAEVRISAIEQQSALLPSHPAAEVFYAAQEGDIGGALPLFSELILFVLASLGLFALSARTYVPLWQDMQENSSKQNALAHPRRMSRLFSLQTKSPTAVLFEKEILTFFRNQRSALWIGFFGLLWLLQIAADVVSRRSALTGGTALGGLPPAVQALQIVVIVYFISMFVLRFVFPSFSIERDTAWLIGSAPVSLRSVYMAKLSFYEVSFALLAAAIVVVHATILRTPFVFAAILFLLVVCMTIVIVQLGLSLGVLFPNFETNDPEELSTSLAGLTFIVVSLLYGSLGAFAFRMFLVSNSTFAITLFVLFSVLAFFLMFLISLRALSRFEFVM